MPAPRDDHAEPARLGLVPFAAAAAQLALLALAVRALRLEEGFGLPAILPLVLAGFCVHAWLPGRWKPPCFLLLSLAGFVLVLGPGPAALVVALSLPLFGLCHLPVRVGLRALALVLAGGALAALRVGWLEASWAATVVPVVAAMFMFRAAIYLYDLRAEERTGLPPGQRPASLSTRLSYFFLLPNVCFLLFPVVDYRTFRRTYYGRPASEIHARGLRWMLRGVVHLLLYRVVYAHLPEPAEIRDLLGVTTFAVSSFLLYLRISGHFHLIVGMLHLFGHHLPETNRNWLLASSFTDCWRRINVYWTEFMKKLVYYPTFVRLRPPGERGMLAAMAAATAATFVATWLLHAYQWFWLNGALPLATDGLFWGLAGTLALGTVLWEARHGAPGALGAAAPSWSAALRRSVQTLGVLASICAVWSLWCTTSLEQWLSILARADDGSPAQALGLLGGVAGIVLLGTVAQRLAPALRAMRPARAPAPSAALTAAGALFVALLGLAPVQAALGQGAAAALAPITGDFLNRRDRERLLASYYDRLIDREVFGGRASERAPVDPDDPVVFMESPIATVLGPPLFHGIAPSRREVYLGTVVETNRWGMRDREYALEKPAGTFRIAVLGTCYEMGAGVEREEVWEEVAEELLNREVSPRTGLAYEVLNFSVPGYSLLHHVALVRGRVQRFQPDLVVVSNHVSSTVKHLVRLAEAEAERPTGFAEILARTGVRPGMGEVEVRRRAGPLRAWIEEWAFGEIAAACERLGASPALLDVPFIDYTRGFVDEAYARRIEEQVAVVRVLGFEVLDASDAFTGHRMETIALARLPQCPSAKGHRLLGERFYEALVGDPRTQGAP